jgi:hypothetical protein
MKKYLLCTLLAVLATSSYAATIKLYDQPNTNNKLIGSLDSAVGIITIFNPKDNKDWVKVADPRNGNVGWVKSNDLQQANVSFNITTSGTGGQQYQVFQYGNMAPPNAEQKIQIQKIRQQQQAIERDMQQMMQTMFHDMHYTVGNFPMIVPVVVIPEKMMPQSTRKTTSTEAMPTKTTTQTPKSVTKPTPITSSGSSMMSPQADSKATH